MNFDIGESKLRSFDVLLSCMLSMYKYIINFSLSSVYITIMSCNNIFDYMYLYYHEINHSNIEYNTFIFGNLLLS